MIGIIDKLVLLVNVIISLFVGLLQMLANIPEAMQMLVYGIAALPAEITAYAALFISVSVIYLIIGR